MSILSGRGLVVVSRIRTFWVCTGKIEEGQEKIFYVGIGMVRRDACWPVIHRASPSLTTHPYSNH